MKTRILYFLAGFYTCNALFMIFQDALGKQGFIEYTQTHWTSGWWTWALSIFTLVTVPLVFVFEQRMARMRLETQLCKTRLEAILATLEYMKKDYQ